MKLDQLKQEVILRGSVLPEPVEIIYWTPVGNEVKLVGKGLTTGLVRDPILAQEQLSLLDASPEKEPYSGCKPGLSGCH